jgi:UDP-glucose 4-epimerase
VTTVLLTGGTGYIGSHTCVELINAGFGTVLFDNLCNSSMLVLESIEKITGKKPHFVYGDVRDRQALDNVFNEHAIDAVLHFAGLKAVADSVARPLEYYVNNVCGSATLLEAMDTHGVRRIAFSSSATVYDPDGELPFNETSPTRPVNPYGYTKLMVEQILHDITAAALSWRTICLRYFNPVGAHESGLIGEDPVGMPNNIMPYISQVAAGRLPQLRIFGRDYPTLDGTGVRDYIHVSDLAMGHLAAIQLLLSDARTQHGIVNLGRGRGYSVLELLRTFINVTGREVPHVFVGRRAGDVAASYADVTVAGRYLNWKAQRDLATICADAWRWQSAQANG